MPKTKFICQECGKEFEEYASKYPNGIAKYCSLKCNGQRHKGKETEKRKYIKCDNCGKKILMYKWQYEKAQNHFCSSDCHDEFRNKHITISCEFCNKDFSVKLSRYNKSNPRFCSWSCRSKSLVGENHFNYTSEIRKCKKCGAEFQARQSEINLNKALYCSKKCFYSSLKLERPKDSKYFYATSFWKNLKIECFKKDNYTCQICGSRENLHSHHIVPRRKGGKDELDNLQTLCSSCHRKVESSIINKI